jgi:hypothetical protein
MTIRMDVHRRLSVDPSGYSGATADVFDVNGLAYKVFRVYGVARSPEQVSSLFESECDAYRRATYDAWLQHHTAAFYGPSILEDIIDSQGKSVGNLYALDCCYRMELLVGSEAKYRDGRCQAFEYLPQAQTRFLMNRIDVLDSSVFNYDDAVQFRFIDFRMDYD